MDFAYNPLKSLIFIPGFSLRVAMIDAFLNSHHLEAMDLELEVELAELGPQEGRIRG